MDLDQREKVSTFLHILRVIRFRGNMTFFMLFFYVRLYHLFHPLIGVKCYTMGGTFV